MSETAGAAGPLASLPGRMLAGPALALVLHGQYCWHRPHIFLFRLSDGLLPRGQQHGLLGPVRRPESSSLSDSNRPPSFVGFSPTCCGCYLVAIRTHWDMERVDQTA